MEWNWSVLAVPRAGSSHDMMDSCVFSSFTQPGCQPEENEDNKSEEESQGKNQNPFGVGGGERVIANWSG